MIGQIRGKLIEKHPPHLMIEVGGIGYCVQSPLSTFFHLPKIGEEITLRTHFIVREDAQLLYGFSTQGECRLFQTLIKINAVGPKVALALLSAFSPEEFTAIVFAKEAMRLKAVPGIGGKMAQRILVEMEDKLPKLQRGDSIFEETTDIVQPSASAKQEALMALVALGYKQAEALKAVNKVAPVHTSDLACENILKEALQGLAKV